ncbi:MAG: isoprenylcysteine carboxylmethyltransferase family protein [Chloroflexi bacterium]|nr:isoprenylcysteine carboxylmethyltransferase family protein [Chloroflexota bacterium]
MVWIVIAIAAWGIVHSLLASIQFKDFLRGKLGIGIMRAYRFSYNIFSVITFAPILVLMKVLPDRPFYAVAPPWMYFMLAGQGLAILCLLITFLQTDALSFVGLRQFVEDEKPSALVMNGFYRLVRHPLYLFSLLFIWLSPVMTFNMLIVWVSLTAYLFIGAYFEERKLLREFGSAYANYKSRTPMMIPGLIFKRNK